MSTNADLWVSRWIPLRMRKFSDKICIEDQNTFLMFNNFFFFLENRAGMWYVDKPGTATQATDGNVTRRKKMQEL